MMRGETRLERRSELIDHRIDEVASVIGVIDLDLLDPLGRLGHRV